MNQFAKSMRRAIARYESQGVTCHQRVGTELEMYNKALPPKVPEFYQQLPLAERIKQMKRVKRLVKNKEMSVRDACDKVGIGYNNYKSVCVAHKKGLTKRP